MCYEMNQEKDNDKEHMATVNHCGSLKMDTYSTEYLFC